MRADRKPRVRDRYATLVTTLRDCAGKQASIAWKTPPIERDEDMGVADLYQALEPVREAQRTFEGVAATSSPRRWVIPSARAVAG